ncbi:MAG TPA: ring-cleaving dioxygenase [Pseudolabrys sp.]|nr:ring-cleaving dioxygenase [Pseudolabrys sp.]
MTRTIAGIHHVTAICGPPQPNVDFYTGPLGQRLVKKTVNFDAPDTYHLYYGDRIGSPGTILTFFPFADAGPGRAGPGMASAVAYGVPQGGLDAWMMRLAEEGIDSEGPIERFGQRMITVADSDRMPVELIETETAGVPDANTDARVEHPAEGPREDGFHSVTLWVADPAPTARVLTDLFGYEAAGQETADGVERLRFRSPSGSRGSVVDILRSDTPSIGRQGAGTIHHVAFRAEDDAAQLEWRERAMSMGLNVTPVIDRQYFNAIYFREPGGVLFEIATDPPGFATDEAPDELGTHLKLPPQYEVRRADIERVLPPLRVRS